MAIDDTEAGGGIVEWPELTPLLPRRSLHGLQSYSMDSDATGMEAVTHKVRRVYRQSMAAENKRITLCLVLVLLAILLSGSVVMVVSAIKSRPNSEAYIVADEISHSIIPSWPDEVGTVVGVSSGGDSTESGEDLDTSTATFDLSTSPSSSDSNTTPSLENDNDKDTTSSSSTTKPPPNTDTDDIDSTPGTEEGPAVGPGGPRPTISPTVYDPLAPTRKPSPDPNETKKPRSVIHTSVYMCYQQ